MGREAPLVVPPSFARVRLFRYGATIARYPGRFTAAIRRTLLGEFPFGSQLGSHVHRRPPAGFHLLRLALRTRQQLLPLRQRLCDRFYTCVSPVVNLQTVARFNHYGKSHASIIPRQDLQRVQEGTHYLIRSSSLDCASFSFGHLEKRSVSNGAPMVGRQKLASDFLQALHH